MTLASLIPPSSTNPATVTPLVPNNTASSSLLPNISFSDVVSALNPLQHIPVVSSLYRAATGNSISTGSQLVGDTLYGGLAGGATIAFASSLADVAVKTLTGENIGQHAVATLNAAVSTVSSLGTGSTTGATPLVPYTGITQAQAATLAGNPVTPASQAQAAVALLSHTNSANATQSSAQYTRTQAFDAMNRQLVKMTV